MMAVEAAQSAQAAAVHGKKAATQAAEAALLLTAGAEGDRARAEQAVGKAESALEASRRFEEAIRGATLGELRLAWESARRTQADCLMGSKEWGEARTVSELLRMEYLAATDARDS